MDWIKVAEVHGTGRLCRKGFEVRNAQIVNTHACENFRCHQQKNATISSHQSLAPSTTRCLNHSNPSSLALDLPYNPVAVLQAVYIRILAAFGLDGAP